MTAYVWAFLESLIGCLASHDSEVFSSWNLDLVVFLIFNLHIKIEHVGERDWKDLLGKVFILLEKNSKLIYFKKKY